MKTTDRWCGTCAHHGDKKTCAKCWRANPMSRMADYDDLWTPNDEWVNDHGCSSCKYRSLSASEEPCDTCAFQDKWESADDDPDWTPYANQDAKADAGKAQLTMVPRRIIWDIARVRMYGNRKYGDPENWRTVSKERYRDAAFRHFLAYLDNPDGVDEESGIKHLHHLACNIAFLCEMEDNKND